MYGTRSRRAGRRRTLALAAALAMGALVTMGACRGRPPPLDRQARALVERLESAVEEKDSEAVRELLAPEFRGGDDLDRREAVLMLRARLTGRPSVHVITRVVTVELATPPYRVEVLAAMASLPITAEELVRSGAEADVYRFFLDLVPSPEERGALIVSAARWEPARLLDFQ